MLRWSPPPPIHVNGIIDHYVIRVREVYTGRVFSLLTEDTSILLGPLHPYYVYSCQIAAYTISLGPFSPPISVQAGETREFNAPCVQYYGIPFHVFAYLLHIQDQQQLLKMSLMVTELMSPSCSYGTPLLSVTRMG